MAPAKVELLNFLKPALCANQHTTDGEVKQCSNDTNNTCKGCRLVQYCSKECHEAYWYRHKDDCKSALMKSGWIPGWHREGRNPTRNPIDFNWKELQKYLWGNLPALDILNIKDNEGPDASTRDFDLLFAASGDPRNIIKTVVGLPFNYRASAPSSSMTRTSTSWREIQSCCSLLSTTNHKMLFP